MSGVGLTEWLLIGVLALGGLAVLGVLVILLVVKSNKNKKGQE